jgi:uncharacterized coiled-coil DUF342 family protein
MQLSHEFWIQIGVYVIGGIVFVAINAFKLGQLRADLATKEELREKVRERNAQIDRVYERFDEYKKHSENMMVRKDMCGQLHLNTKDEIKKLDDDYKAFRHEIRNTVQQIFDKIDELRMLITERK